MSVVLVIMIFRGSFAYFYALSEFSMQLCAEFKFELHAHAPVHINWLKNKYVSLVACLGPMHEMGMNVKHPATVTRPQTLRYLVSKF